MQREQGPCCPEAGCNLGYNLASAMLEKIWVLGEAETIFKAGAPLVVSVPLVFTYLQQCSADGGEGNYPQYI